MPLDQRLLAGQRVHFLAFDRACRQAGGQDRARQQQLPTREGRAARDTATNDRLSMAVSPSTRASSANQYSALISYALMIPPRNAAAATQRPQL